MQKSKADSFGGIHELNCLVRSDHSNIVGLNCK